MKTEHSIVTVPTRRVRCFATTISFLLVLLAAGLSTSSAKAADQLETGLTTTDSSPVSTVTDSSPVSTVTDTVQSPPLPSSPDGGETIPAPRAETKSERPLHDEPDINPCLNIQVSGDTWMDQTHDYVERNICQPAVWFDHFFGDRSLLEDVRPGTFVTLRNAVRYTEGGPFKLLYDYHLEWQLPQWKEYLRKAKLYFDSPRKADPNTTVPGQPIEPGLNRDTGARKPVIGVRLDLYSRIRSLISIDSGVKLNIHPDAFVRMRYQYSREFAEAYLFRLSEYIMWQAVERFSNSTQITLERTITKFTIARWANNATYTEDTPGMAWNTGISFLTQLTPKSAISYDAGMWGSNYPEWTIENYRIGSKYRRNFYRPWLFFDLDPEVTLPKNTVGQRDPVYAFMATLEIQFGQ